MAKILIIKQGALGDIVMSTALIRQIQQYHAHDELWLLTTPAYPEIFGKWPGLHVVAFGRKGAGAMFKAVRWTRKERFLRVYDLQSSDRSGLLCALSGIPEKVGNHPRFPYNLHPADKYTGQCHIYERMLAVLRAAGIKAVYALPGLPLSDEDKNFVMGWLREKQLADKPFVILHPGASPGHPEKRWPFFLELALALHDAGYSIVWAGADNERGIIGQFSGRVGIDACNIFSINMLAGLGRHARFAVTNDSGPMHVLSCSGIPVYAFFGPTDWRRNHAIGQVDHVLTMDLLHPAPAPAIAGGDLRLITVEDVLRRLRQDGRLTA